MNLNNCHTIYFIGIGGIGMSALARYFVSEGKTVLGYDSTPSEITSALQSIGVEISFEDDTSALNNGATNPDDCCVVFTPAIPEDNFLLSHFKGNNFQIYKRAEVLAMITNQTQCLAIAGTHGKTTTTSILGHLLKVSHQPMIAFLGGISENYNSNLIQNGSAISVVEADEFDRSFMVLNPDLACITSIDADHLDIYGAEEDLVSTFAAFAQKIETPEKLFIRKGLPFDGITYAVDEVADYYATNITIHDGSYHFDLKTPKTRYNNFIFSLPGRYNLSNAVVAIAMALELGCDVDLLRSGLESYKGVKRRFTHQIKTDDFVLIDDYAHHPKEIDAVFGAVQEMYPNRETMVVFQPHLYSRTKDFADDFAVSLSQFDAVVLLDIYPARERPIQGVSSEWLLHKINSPYKTLVSKTEIVKEILLSNATVVLTLGAGDIGVEVSNIKKELTHAN